MTYNDAGRMRQYTGQTEIELFLKLRSLIAHPQLKIKKRKKKAKSEIEFYL